MKILIYLIYVILSPFFSSDLANIIIILRDVLFKCRSVVITLLKIKTLNFLYFHKYMYIIIKKLGINFNTINYIKKFLIKYT